MITRNNYEEFFLLYADNELPVPEKKAVEEFVQENPDLAEELLKLQDAVLVPDSHIIFENKAALLKPTAGSSFINDSNYEGIFLSYIDNELDEAGKKEVELFAVQHPFYTEALTLLQQTRMEPDFDIVFENKAVLYREEEKDKVVVLPWFRIAAAAIVLLVVGLYVFNHTKTTTGTLVTTDSKKNSNPENKKEQVAVTSAGTHPLDSTEGTKKNATADVKSTDQQTAKADPIRSRKVTPENTKSTVLQATELTPKTDMAKPTTLAAVDVANNTVNNPASARLAASTLNDVPDNKLVAKADSRTDVEEKTQEINYIQQHLQEENAAASNTTFFVASSSAKKSKLRGIFRKVSRVFDKEASADDDNSKRGVLIGSFQIALK